MTGAVARPVLVVALGALWWWRLPFPGLGADPVVALLAGRSPWLYEAVRAWHYLAPGVGLIVGTAGAHAVARGWRSSWGKRIRAVLSRWAAAGRRRAAAGGRWAARVGDRGGAILVSDHVRLPLVVLSVGVVWWRFLPFPPAGADPVVGLLAGRSPWLYEAVRAWHYLAPGVALIGCWSVMQSVARVWFASRRRAAGAGTLPPWPLTPGDATPALVLGELHHPVALQEVDDPAWLQIPERGLYTGIIICGAVGSGKTSACMRPFARQLLSWQADDPDRRIAGLVLEVKGDFCYQVRDLLVEAGRGGDYIELGLKGKYSWNPLGAHWLDSYSLAYTIASLINQLFGKGHEPFWQQAYTNLVRWVIELHRMCPGGWVTLQDVYRCTVESGRIETLIGEVTGRVDGQTWLRIEATAVAKHPRALGKTFKRIQDTALCSAPGSDELEAELKQLKVLWTRWDEPASDVASLADKRRLDAIRRWYTHDWSKLDPKVASTIVEGLSVFLSVFDLPDVADVFCPPPPPVADAGGSGSAPGASAARHRLPPLDEVIESGKVLALNMPAGSNAALARAVGVMLKQSWLHTLLRRPAAMAADPARVFRPAMFLCDEYQAFATVGEDDPSGDEKAFALTRQCRLVPIVATQSISSLRAVLGHGEAWRALLQTLRTRIFLSLSDDASAQLASGLCGQVARMKASYTVSEQTQRASASLLSGAAGGGTGSVGASKAFSEKREPLFHPRDFTILGNCQAIVQPYDGTRSLDATRCYLKPDFLPRNRPYWRARSAGEL